VERSITRKTEQVWNGFYPAIAAADDDTHGTSLLGVKINDSHNRPGVVQRVPEGLGSQTS